MLTIYLTTLIAGGCLLLLSMFAGADHETGHCLEGHLDSGGAEPDGGGGDDVDFGGFDAWLPIASLRFWTFFAAFFGLVGAALTLVGELGTTAALVTSIGVGYFSGVGATNVLRSLAKQRVGKVIGANDLVGVSGTLMLPAGPGQPGKIRFQFGGRVLEELAYSDDDSMALGSRVLIIAKHDGGGVQVSPAPLLEEGKD